MSIQISFELSDSDLTHFRNLMSVAIEKLKNRQEHDIIGKAEALCHEMENSDLPDFISERLTLLKKLIEAVKDAEWQMPEEDRCEVLSSISYFCESEDLIPDKVPRLGYLDDAILIELIIQDMSFDLQAYDSFCSFRRSEKKRRGSEVNVNREDWLASARLEMRRDLRRNKASLKRNVFSRMM